jgi:NitT/TauT family transport system ATP-binding protein
MRNIADPSAAAPVPGVAPSVPLIEFRNAGLVLGGRTIVDDVSLRVDRGEFVCLVGASGCGKTTLLRLLAGLLHPTSGSVFYDGKPVVRPRRDIAVVFQDYSNALLPWRTAFDNVALPLEDQPMTKHERRERVLTLLDCVGLVAEQK